MGIYEPLQRISVRGNTNSFGGDNSSNHEVPSTVHVDAKGDNMACISYGSSEYSQTDKEIQTDEKGKKRLVQNREAARKSRLRKKAYVHELEESRTKLAMLEQEVEKARKQGLLIGCMIGNCHLESGNASSGIAAFEMKYVHWVEEQHRQVSELRNAMQVHVTDIELRILIENGLNHYYNLFEMKADAAKIDVFYLMSGTWRTAAERFFLWIGGFRPSELLNVMLPQLEPLTEKQLEDIGHLRKSFQNSENSVSRDLDDVQKNLAQMIATLPADVDESQSHESDMTVALGMLGALEQFVCQADGLRQEMLQQMASILTIRQTARGLLALGEYFHRLRALSSIWVARPRESESG